MPDRKAVCGAAPARRHRWILARNSKRAIPGGQFRNEQAERGSHERTSRIRIRCGRLGRGRRNCCGAISRSRTRSARCWKPAATSRPGTIKSRCSMGSRPKTRECASIIYVRHYADEKRQEKDPKYASRTQGRAAWGLLSACAHTRRLHGALRDDHYPAARQRLADDQRRDRRSELGPRRDEQVLRTRRTCLYRDDSAGGHGKDGWLPTKFADVIDLAGACDTPPRPLDRQDCRRSRAHQW